MRRAVAAGVAVVAATASGVITALLTAHSSWGLWVALGVLVVFGAVLQGAIIAAERRASVSGAGSMAVGGSAGEFNIQHRGDSVRNQKPGDSPPTARGVSGDHPGD
jgi:hypothetical protein